MIAAFSDWSLLSLAVLTALVCVGFAWFGALFIRPFLRLFIGRRGGQNDVVGYVLSSFGVLYGILLGLTAVAAYQNWSTVDANLTAEAAALTSTFQAVSLYPEPARQQLRGQLQDLALFEVETEWPELVKGHAVPGGRAKVTDIEAGLIAYEPATSALTHVQERAVDQFNTFIEQRRLRIYSTNSGIPPILWYVVLAGALINMVLVWLLDSRLLAQLLLGGLLAFFIGATILLIAVLARPFQSTAGVGPDALIAAHEFMMKE